MKHLGMIRGELNRSPLTHHLVGDGNLDTVIHARADGFFQREVALLEAVKAKQRLGAILDASGVEKESVEADQDGVIIMLRRGPRVKAGDGVAHVTQSHRPRQ